MPATSGAASPLVIPGITVTSSPAARRCALSSPPRPNRNGSPPFSRTTVCPARASCSISRSMNACGVLREPLREPPRLPTAITRVPGRVCSSTARLTRSSTSTTSAARSARTAANVSNSGSPGPAPTRNTLPIIWLTLGYELPVVLHRHVTGLAAARDAVAGVLQMMANVVDHLGIAADHDAAAFVIELHTGALLERTAAQQG